MMSSASNNNHSGGNFTVEGNDVLSATEYSKYRQAKALDDIIRATQHLTERERQAVFQLAQNPHMFCPDIRPTPTNNNTLPNLGSNPNATNVMQGVVARLSGFSDRDKVKYHGLIENMGGSFKHELGVSNENIASGRASNMLSGAEASEKERQEALHDRLVKLELCFREHGPPQGSYAMDNLSCIPFDPSSDWSISNNISAGKDQWWSRLKYEFDIPTYGHVKGDVIPIFGAHIDLTLVLLALN